MATEFLFPFLPSALKERGGCVGYIITPLSIAHLFWLVITRRGWLGQVVFIPVGCVHVCSVLPSEVGEVGEIFVGLDIGVLVAKGDKAIEAAIGVMNGYPDFLVDESRGIKLYFLVGGGCW
ncbi:hypothetical protein ES705_36661 [subsurface metagenome]